MVDMSAEQYQYAYYQLKEAAERLERIKEYRDKSEYIFSVEVKRIITDGQLVIETATKCMFSFLGINSPREHGIDFTDHETQALLEKILKSTQIKFDRKDKIPRAIFLTQLWSEFYSSLSMGFPNKDSLQEIYSTSEMWSESWPTLSSVSISPLNLEITNISDFVTRKGIIQKIMST